MMSKVKVPFYSYKSGDKNPVIHYQLKFKTFGNLYLTNETRYIDSDLDSEPNFNIEFLIEFFKANPSEFESNNLSEVNNLSEFNNLSETNNTVQPNYEKPGGPNPYTNKKILFNNFEYDPWNKHVECSEQQRGAAHPALSGTDFKFI